MIQENEVSIKNGWKIGVAKETEKKLNSDIYPESWMGEQEDTEMAAQLTEEMLKGKVIPITGGEKGNL